MLGRDRGCRNGKWCAIVNEAFRVRGDVERFPQEGGWVYVRVPEKYTDMTRPYANRGLVPITAQIRNTTWQTSLLPMGDGTHFIALSAKVRKAEDVQVGGKVSVTFRLRRRVQGPQ